MIQVSRPDHHSKSSAPEYDSASMSASDGNPMEDAHRRREEQLRGRRAEMQTREVTRRVLRALISVAGFTSGGTEAEFVKEWAGLWCEAARRVRDDADAAWVLNMPLPDDPAYAVARELFRKALDGADAAAMTEALSINLERLKAAPGEEWMNVGPGRYPLREFFRLAAEVIQRHLEPDDGAPTEAEESRPTRVPCSTVRVVVHSKGYVVATLANGKRRRLQESDLSKGEWRRLLEFAAAQGTIVRPREPRKDHRWRKKDEGWRKMNQRLAHKLQDRLALIEPPFMGAGDGSYTTRFKEITLRLERDG